MTEAEKMFNATFNYEKKLYERIMREATKKIKSAVKKGEYETYLYFSDNMCKYIPRMTEELENKGYVVSGGRNSGFIKISWDMEATKI